MGKTDVKTLRHIFEASTEIIAGLKALKQPEVVYTPQHLINVNRRLTELFAQTDPLGVTDSAALNRNGSWIGASALFSSPALDKFQGGNGNGSSINIKGLPQMRDHLLDNAQHIKNQVHRAYVHSKRPVAP